jgi:glyoxylase-like metal-dependent hydrolase (beta-lactamase superfamily II)
MHKSFQLRSFCTVAVLLALASIAYAQGRGGQPNPPPPALPNLQKIKDDLYLITNSDVTPEALRYWGGNITVLLTKDGVILIDAKYARAHDDVVAKVKSLTDKPIKYVILTHNHGDHSEGAPQLEAMGATVIISNDDRENMTRAANPTWLPSVTYIGQSRLFLGGKELQLSQFRGHTRGDTVVYFPALRVIVLGDLLTTNDLQPPIVNYGDGGSWTDWTTSMNEVLKMDFDVAIPGHGPMVTKNQVAAIRDKFVAIQQRVRSLNREKKTQEEIAATLMNEFHWAPANNIPGMIQELR